MSKGVEMSEMDRSPCGEFGRLEALVERQRALLKAFYYAWQTDNSPPSDMIREAEAIVEGK